MVGAMDKVWSGGGAPEGYNGSAHGAADAQSGVDSAQQQQARLAVALQSTEDSEDVYVQVRFLPTAAACCCRTSICPYGTSLLRLSTQFCRTLARSCATQLLTILPCPACCVHQVASKQLVGIYLSVWARKGVARSIRGVQATSAATGWGGYLGNKGAVAVRLRVYDAPLVVVCSHLASGDARGDEQRRNADVADIMRRCVFDNTDAAGGWFVEMCAVTAVLVRSCYHWSPSQTHAFIWSCEKAQA